MKIDPRDANIELHIEELVLHGFETGDRYAIAEAVGREMERLLSEQTILNKLIGQEGMTQQCDTGFVALDRSNSQELGAQIAKFLYGVVNPRE